MFEDAATGGEDLHDVLVWLYAQIDVDERFAVTERDSREVRLKRALANFCERYSSVEDDPAYDLAIEILDLVLDVYEDRPGRPAYV